MSSHTAWIGGRKEAEVEVERWRTNQDRQNHNENIALRVEAGGPEDLDPNTDPD